MNGNEYHRRTRYNRFAMKGHALDWPNQPALHKHYPSAPATPLEKPRERFGKTLEELVCEKGNGNRRQSLGMAELSDVLAAGYGHTAEKKGPGWRFRYRSAASAGALYPAEIYLAAGGAAGLAAGLYHYDGTSASLRQLRKKDPGTLLMDALFSDESGRPCCTFVITGIFFRSAWKYRERAYRYVLLDAGHVAENLVLALKAVGCAISVHYDFEDRTVAKLLGLDTDREVPLIAINVFGDARETTGDIADPADWLHVPPELFGSCAVSAKEVFYDEIGSAYRSGIGPAAGDAGCPGQGASAGRAVLEWVRPTDTGRREAAPDFAEVIRARRSRRNFSGRAWAEDSFWSVLNLTAAAAGRDRVDGYPCGAALSTGFLAGEQVPLPPGLYRLNPPERQYGRVTREMLNGMMADICLGQQWLANAPLQFVFTANLEALDDCCGARGYRYAMINAGRIGQLIYLAAADAGVGCCGIGAFFDPEATELLNLEKGWAMLYLVAAGPVKGRSA